MALESLKLLRISIFLLLLAHWRTYAQTERVDFDSVFTKVYDSNIKAVENAKIMKANKPLILVSTSHCSACVNYFAQSQKHYRFIFVINNKSLLEINRLLSFYNLHASQVYFVIPDDIKQKKKIILNGPTPLAFSTSGNALYFIGYPTLNAITNEFTASHKKVAEAFRNQKF